MGKDHGDPVAEAARRRLQLLSQELASAGLAPVHGDDPGPSPVAPAPEAATPAVVPEPGRHARARRVPPLGRLAAWCSDRVPAGMQGRVRLGAAHVAVLALVVALALAAAAVMVLRSQPRGEAVPAPRPAASLVSIAPADSASSGEAAGESTGESTDGSAPGGSSAGADVAPESGVVVVDVSGKVRHPGVTTLPAGSRVVDALRRAGGARPGVRLTSLNLARVLVDGEQILVGVPGATGAAPAAASAPGGAGGAPGDGVLVNINTATESQLEELPGVGPVTAASIVGWRNDHGRFTSVDDLLEIDGIGEKTLAQLAPHVTL